MDTAGFITESVAIRQGAKGDGETNKALLPVEVGPKLMLNLHCPPVFIM